MKRALPYLILLIVAGLWVKAYGDKRASDALAAARRDSLEAALDSAAAVGMRLAQRDRQLAIHEAGDRARALASRQRETAQRMRADSTTAVLDSVLASLPDTAPLSVAITNERQAGASCRTALGDCEALGLTLTARVAVLDSTVHVLQPALDATRRMWEAAERARHPSLFGRLRIALPFVVVGIAGWELIR